MTINQHFELVFFLEGRSEAELLHGLVPRLLGHDVQYRCVPFSGKQDLEKQLPRKLRGWMNPNAVFIVLRDQDAGDCKSVKQNLINICAITGKDAIIRIACRELESWYLGDLSAVGQAYSMDGLAGLQNQKKFRNPDYLSSPSKELETLTKKQYQKISGSRALGALLSLVDNTSNSFHAFVNAVKSSNTL